MSSATPKLLYSNSLGYDIPVWEIIPEHGDSTPIYYERVDYPGMIPIGQKTIVTMGDYKYDVFDVVNHHGSEDLPVLKAKNGFIAPMSWYEYEDRTMNSDHMETGREYCDEY